MIFYANQNGTLQFFFESLCTFVFFLLVSTSIRLVDMEWLLSFLELSLLKRKYRIFQISVQVIAR